MNRQEAIDVLRNIGHEIDDFCNGGKHWSDKDKEELEALDMAIEALQEPTREWTIQNCPKCGKFALEDWIVCPYCGANMRSEEE